MQSYPYFGDVFYAELQADGHIQGGKRPVLIVQNNVGNRHSPTVEILPITSQIEKAKRKNLPTQVIINASIQNGLIKDSVVIGEQPRTINKTQLFNKLGSLTRNELVKIGRARNVQSPFPTI